MSRVRFRCPSCAELIVAPAALEGQSRECPRCKALVAWPAPVAPPPVPPPYEVVETNATQAEVQRAPDFRERNRTAAYCAIAIVLGIAISIGPIQTLSEDPPSIMAILPEREKHEKQRRVAWQKLFVGTILFAGGIGVLASFVPSLTLRAKFESVAPLIGKAQRDVFAAMGDASEIKSEGEGEARVERVTWATHLFTVTAEFRGGFCAGCETSSRAA